MKFERIFCFGDSITLGHNDIDYLQLFPKLLKNPRYQAALLAGDRVHPGDDGHALIAERITARDKWRELL